MKGVILAGGLGTRLGQLTKLTNKHLINIWNKQMILYPLETLKNAGVKDILVITGPEHAGDFLRLLGSGKDHWVNLTFRLQDEPGGIAQALSLAQDFVGKDKCMVILGDNIFEDTFKQEAESFETQQEGAKIFLKQIQDPERFGVAEIQGEKIISIEEKPKNPKSNYAVTGLYMYDSSVFRMIRALKPSGRGELEITDVNNAYIQKGKMSFSVVKGFWTDAGTYDSLFRASELARSKETR